MVEKSCQLLGRTLPTPLGIAAGPLLNGAWLLYYAQLGFDFLTYKTVRSTQRACYPIPNLQPVEAVQLDGRADAVRSSHVMRGSWAVSFGMPSQPPEVWRRDIQHTREALAPEKMLSVSVVGTEKPGWTMQQLAEDYALCAEWAIASGADCVETNLSCPNVETCDGQLYQQPESAALVADCVRRRIGDAPLLVKIGHFVNPHDAARFVSAVGPMVDAIVTTNSIAARVENADGDFMFDGRPRGICGDATRDASLIQTREIARLLREEGRAVDVVGVGGIRTASHVDQYLAAGASAVQLATEVMINPDVGLNIRAEWKGR